MSMRANFIPGSLPAWRLWLVVHNSSCESERPLSGVHGVVYSKAFLARRRYQSYDFSPLISRGVALFEFLNLDLGLVFRVIHRLADLLPAPGGLFGSRFLVRFTDLLRGVLGIAPGFLPRTVGLIDYPFVGQLFATNTFSDALLHYAHRLIDLASHLILIHEFHLYSVSLRPFWLKAIYP